MANELFAWQRALRDESGLPQLTKHVLLTLSTYMKQDGTGAFPAQQTLADACGVSVRTVRKHIADAIEAGWIEKVRQGRHVGRGSSYSNEYAISDLWTWSAGGTGSPPGTVDSGPAGGSPAPTASSQEADGAPQEAPDDPAGGSPAPPNTSLPLHKDHRAGAIRPCPTCRGLRLVGGERSSDGSLAALRECPACIDDERRTA